jgi:uroporphyrinogen-III decarboxylase
MTLSEIAGNAQSPPAMPVAGLTRDLISSTGGNSNFVVSSGCHVPAATPHENLDAFFREAATSH